MVYPVIRVAVLLLLVVAGVLTALPVRIWAQTAVEAPLEGNAFAQADEAYKAFAAGDYLRTIEKVQKVIALRPDLLRLRLLLIDALISNGDYDGASNVVTDTLVQFPAAASDLSGRKALITQALPQHAPPGFQAADAAYDAQKKGDLNTAIAKARRAVSDDPSSSQYRALLVNLLLAARFYTQAEQAANDAELHGISSAELLSARGFARVHQKKMGVAIQDFDRSLSLGLPSEQEATVRIAIADAALETNQPQRVLRILSSMRPSYNVVIRRAYALQKLGKKEQALYAFTTAANLTSVSTDRDLAIHAAIGLFVELNKKDEARQLFVGALRRGYLQTIRKVDLAYVASSIGDDRAALEYFDEAKAVEQPSPKAALDAAYTAKRQFENGKATAYFTDAINAQSRGLLSLDPQRLFDVRRENADLGRQWGINTSLFYGKAGAALNPFTNIIPQDGYTSQIGTEFYYRPEAFGYHNGATFEFVARLFQTIYDQAGGKTGIDTTQGILGALWKPFADQNLVLEASKLTRLGKIARDDTLLRAAYSYTQGTDLRVVEPGWWTWQVSGEVDRYVENPQLVGIAEARMGRSFRLDAIGHNLVVFPHIVLAANYDDSYAVRDALGAGIGTSIRYWFGETQYIAPPSYLDLTVQYRARLAGAKRAEGLFAQAAINY
jgi:tetratricopeptide (TPR) repeat protein